MGPKVTPRPFRTGCLSLFFQFLGWVHCGPELPYNLRRKQACIVTLGLPR